MNEVNIEELLQYNDGSVIDAYEHLKKCRSSDCTLCVAIHKYLSAYQAMSDKIKEAVRSAFREE